MVDAKNSILNSNTRNQKHQHCSSGNTTKTHNSQNTCKINITPAQALVIGGILTGVFDVFSFLIDVNQNIEITLLGNIKPDDPAKPDLNKILETLGSVPLDDVLRAIINRLS